MNVKDFVDAIKLVVSDATISDTVEVLSSPPGKKPNPRLVEISNFYNQQSADGKSHIDAIIKKSVEEAVFGFFCVLDGVRAIEPSSNNGILSLLYEGNLTVKLNAGADMHDHYNSVSE
ncbi:hypothetical protein [Pseudomonas syringae]|uniref:hypothetical protein n=1 Tax=Pseudomonas syringae TaxID=317 RepID=UPI0005159E7E|nr:hypothetical protein [Pseudomonas syringae]